MLLHPSRIDDILPTGSSLILISLSYDGIDDILRYYTALSMALPKTFVLLSELSKQPICGYVQQRCACCISFKRTFETLVWELL